MNPIVVHMGLLADKVKLGRVSLREFRFPFANDSTNAPYLCIIGASKTNSSIGGGGGGILIAYISL
jgi:hypothetical protein